MSFCAFEGGALGPPWPVQKSQLNSDRFGPSYTIETIQNPTFGQNYRPTTLTELKMLQACFLVDCRLPAVTPSPIWATGIKSIRLYQGLSLSI
jgi:hypothetical protein